MSDPIRPAAPLPPSVITQLSAIRAAILTDIAQGREAGWYRTYAYINTSIKWRADIDQQTKCRFEQAEHINQGTGYSSECIRANTANGLEIMGHAPVDMQHVSDRIAASVVDDIITHGTIADEDSTDNRCSVQSPQAGGATTTPWQ